MATKLAKIIADFTTQLSAKIAIGGTTGQLQSNLDDDGVAMVAGLQYFTLDGNNARKEYIQAVVDGSGALTAVKNVSRQGVLTSGTLREHRAGALVEITDFANILFMEQLLDGTTSLNGSTPLSYDSQPTFTPGSNQLATVGYVETLANQGASTASTAAKGIVKVSTTPADPDNPIAVSDNDPRMPTLDEKGAMAGGTAADPFVQRSEATDRLQTSATEETSSGITAGVPVYIQSDGEASKNATVKTFLSIGNWFPHHRLFDYDDAREISNFSICWLTESKFAFVFNEQTSTSAYDQVAGVGWIDKNNRVGVWSFKSIDGSNAGELTISRLSDSKFIIARQVNTTASIYVCSLDANNAITVGTKDDTSIESGYFSISRLSDSSFVFAYRDAVSDDCYVKAASVTGVAITFGSAVQFDAASSQDMKIVGMTATKAIVIWNSAVSNVQSRVVNISGTTVTAGTNTYTIEAVNGSYLFVDKISDSKFVAVYLNATQDTKLAVGTFSGDVITLGSPITIADGDTGAVCAGVAGFGTDACVVAYDFDDGSPMRASFSYVTISGTTPTEANDILVSSIKLPSNSTQRSSIAVIAGRVMFIIDQGNKAYNQLVYVFEPIINEVMVGVAKSAPVANVVPIIHKGRTGALYSSLTFGKRYRFNQDGTINENGVFGGGLAISTTELLLD